MKKNVELQHYLGSKENVDRESRLNPRKIKETIHSLKNPNHINKISYMLPEIWPPNLRQFLVIQIYLSYTRFLTNETYV